MSKYTLYMVDDEPPVIEGLKITIKRLISQFEVVGFSYNGRDALDGILSTGPDVVLMDIQMPGLGGMDVIRRLREEGYKGIFILVTAYERFDIAKEAFSLGVFDYLLKPISPKKLVTSLDSVTRSLAKRKRERIQTIKTEEQMQEAIPLLEQGFLYSVLAGMESRDPQVYSSYISLPQKGGQMVLFNALDPKIEQSHWDTLTRKIKYQFPLVMSKVVHNRMWALSPFAEYLKESIYQFLLEETLDDKIGVSVGGFQPYGMLFLSVQDALKGVEEVPDEKEVWSRIMSQFSSFRSSIFKKAEEEAKSIWKDTFSLQYFSFPRALGVFYRFFLPLEEEIGGLGRKGFWLKIEAAELVEHIIKIGESAIEELLSQMSLGANYSSVTKSAIEYIEANFSQAISQEVVAQNVHVSPAYLSRLFTGEVKKSFIDFLTEYRINHAKKLIRQSSMSIKEVAPACGYSDPNYFSRLFKKIVGLTPSEYLKTNKAGE